jgi:hypothetical protein
MKNILEKSNKSFKRVFTTALFAVFLYFFLLFYYFVFFVFAWSFLGGAQSVFVDCLSKTILYLPILLVLFSPVVQIVLLIVSERLPLYRVAMSMLNSMLFSLVSVFVLFFSPLLSSSLLIESLTLAGVPVFLVITIFVGHFIALSLIAIYHVKRVFEGS